MNSKIFFFFFTCTVARSIQIRTVANRPKRSTLYTIMGTIFVYRGIKIKKWNWLKLRIRIMLKIYFKIFIPAKTLCENTRSPSKISQIILWNLSTVKSSSSLLYFCFPIFFSIKITVFSEYKNSNLENENFFYIISWRFLLSFAKSLRGLMSSLLVRVSGWNKMFYGKKDRLMTI